MGVILDGLNRPMTVKMLETQGVIARNLLKYGKKTVVSCSFGKDSLVVLYFAVQLKPDVAVLFNNTGVEYPQTTRFAKELAEAWNLNLTVVPPIKKFWDITEEYGFALGDKLSNNAAGKRCCYYLKERAMQLAIRENGWKCVMTGITAAENDQRRIGAATRGMCYVHKGWKVQKVHPILWWTPEEVLWFIDKMGLPNNALYAEGSKRVGCMTCTAYRNWEMEMKRVTPKLYRLMADRMIERGVA